MVFLSALYLLLRREIVNTFGVRVLSEEDNKFKFKFQPNAIKDWKMLAVNNLNFSNELIRQHLCDKVSVSETVFHELQKLSVNSLIFRDYLDELDQFYKLSKEGSIDLSEADIANVWKCLLSLTESKKFLLEASYSLEVH